MFILLSGFIYSTFVKKKIVQLASPFALTAGVVEPVKLPAQGSDAPKGINFNFLLQLEKSNIRNYNKTKSRYYSHRVGLGRH